MTLHSQSEYPSTRSYVLKLRREAMPPGVPLAGRLENLASGRRFAFASGDELLACLVQDLTAAPVAAAGHGEA